MEKFSNFRDEGTGIAPFLPVKPFHSSATKFALYFVGFILILPSMIAILGYVTIIQWIPVLELLYLRFILKLIFRISSVTIYQDGDRAKSSRNGSRVFLRPGSLVIANFTSPLDAIILASQYRCIFLINSNENRFEAMTAVAAACQALRLPQSGKTGLPLDVVVNTAKQTGAIVVYFAEGTTSNGKALLPLKDMDPFIFKNINSEIYPAAFRYTPSYLSTPLPKSILGFIWQILTSSWSYAVSIKIARGPVVLRANAATELSKSICTLGRLRQVGNKFDSDFKRQFNDLYVAKR